MKVSQWIAWRIRREITRDRRTVVFYLLAPLLVMVLVYAALVPENQSKLGIVARGAARLFQGDFENALIKNPDIQLVPTGINDQLVDENEIQEQIQKLLISKKVDAVVWMDENFIEERFSMERGDLHLYLEGSRPLGTADVLKAVADATDDLNMALPVVADGHCDPDCLESFNPLPVNLDKIYLYGDEDADSVNFFLPMFPAFFVFFFTYITSAIAFQRERRSGTLERMAAAPVKLGQVVCGYLLGFSPFAAAQSVIVLAFIVQLLDMEMGATVMASLVMATGLAMMIGLMFGIAISFLSQNEFQVMQTIPVLIIPQVFLSNMIWDIDGFPLVFRYLSKAMPLTYLNDFVRDTVIRGQDFFSAWENLAMAMAFLTLPLLLVQKKGLVSQ